MSNLENFWEKVEGCCKQVVTRVFLVHPQSNGMTYTQHFLHAMQMAVMASASSFVLFVHALVPCLFQKTGSVLNYSIFSKIHEHNDVALLYGYSKLDVTTLPDGVFVHRLKDSKWEEKKSI